jgi:hypothetical protein|tara:strand:+ start:212 stop:577 length:366 start_codon:yes stop_codon:yes gene_type:complete
MNKYEPTRHTGNKVYLIQEIPGTTQGQPKYNIIGAQKYGDIITLLPEFSQMIYSTGPLIHKLRTLLKDATEEDYFLLSGDPAIIFAMGMVVGDINRGKAKVLKWDRQEKTYYPLEINIFQK